MTSHHVTSSIQRMTDLSCNQPTEHDRSALMTLKASARTDFSYNCVVILQSLQICDAFPFVVFLVLPGTCSSRSWSRWCRHTVVSCHSNSHCSTRHLLACWSDWHSLYGMLLDMSRSTLNCHLWGDTMQSPLITQCSHHLSHNAVITYHIMKQNEAQSACAESTHNGINQHLEDIMPLLLCLWDVFQVLITSLCVDSYHIMLQLEAQGSVSVNSMRENAAGKVLPLLRNLPPMLLNKA